jgi:hypothetical protein
MRRRTVPALLILVLASLVLLLPGSGRAAAHSSQAGIVHGDEPFADTACWAVPCEPGGVPLRDLVDGTYDWGDPPPGVAEVLADIQRTTGILPLPQMVPYLRTITLGADAWQLGWRLAANSGLGAWLHLSGGGLGTYTADGVSIGPLQWVWSPDGRYESHTPGWYLYSLRGGTFVSISNCLRASNGSCREAIDGSWNPQTEEAYYQAMTRIHTGSLFNGVCSPTGNGVQVCQYLRYIPASDFWNAVTIDQPLQPYTGQGGMCTGYADRTNGSGIDFEPYQCESGPGANPDPDRTRGKIDDQDDPTRNDFNCRVKPRSWECPRSDSPGGPKPKTRVPLIFLPGIQGSKLTCHGEDYWPNPRWLVADPFETWLYRLKLENDGSETSCHEPLFGGPHALEAPDVIRSIFRVKDVYNKTFDALEAAGYTEGENLFVHAFDWRKSAHANSQALVEKIVALTQGRPGAQVDILAHSQGGLVTRAALTRPEVAGRVRRVVTLGTPVLGAAKLLGVLLAAKPCVLEYQDTCLLNPSAVRDVSRTFPGAYDLMPSAPYTEAVEPPLLINGKTPTEGGYESLAAALMNEPLAQEAFKHHARYDAAVPADPRVKFLRIVGTGHETIGQLNMETGGGKSWYSLGWNANGDGTVPLGSASLYSPPRGYDSRAGIPDLFAIGDGHMALAQDPCVLGYIASSFVNDTPPPLPICLTDSLWLNTRAARLHTATAAGAVELAVDGPVVGTVRDATGGVLGPNPTADDPGHVSFDLPGSNYDAIGDTQSFIANAGDYTATLLATGNDVTRVRVRLWGTGEAPDAQAVFILPTVAAGTSISLDYGSRPLADLRLDVGGTQVAPVAVSTGGAAADGTPPTAYGGATAGPRFLTSTVTLQADDDGSGVASILYSINGGAQTTYSAPFTVPVLAHVTAQAVDRAGNLSAPVTFVADDAPSTERFAAPLGRGELLRFLAPKGDEDWFRFTATGRKTTLELQGLLAADTVQLRSAAGALVAPRRDGGSLSWRLPAGDHTLRIAGDRAGLALLRPYAIALRD